MPPLIREGDQGGTQKIQICLLLLSVLSVFAVKILGDLASKEDAFAMDEHGKEELSILTAKTQRVQRKTRMDPRIREGDQGSRQKNQTCLLLLGVLSVFAVKILGSSGF